jgi:hypothetical protein
MSKSTLSSSTRRRPRIITKELCLRKFITERIVFVRVLAFLILVFTLIDSLYFQHEHLRFNRTQTAILYLVLSYFYLRVHRFVNLYSLTTTTTTQQQSTFSNEHVKYPFALTLEIGRAVFTCAWYFVMLNLMSPKSHMWLWMVIYSYCGPLFIGMLLYLLIIIIINTMIIRTCCG